MTGATDFDIATLRARRTNKWHKFPADVLPAWVADMDFGVAPPITAALARLTDNQEYGYAAREGVLAAAFVRRMERRFGWHTDPADTVAIGDLVQASFSSVMAFSEPGDAVLLQLPSYPPFMAAINDTGRRLIANPMRDDGMRWALDLAAYEAAPDPRTRVLIFCHPQNPTGRAYSRAELEMVADFAIRNDLIVVSDEIHADIVYPGKTHIPLASLHQDIAARTITITSATKSFNIPALRCAVMHFGAPALKERFFARIPARLLGSPGVTGVDATVAAWDDGQPWLEEIMAQLQANRDWLAQTIATELPGVTMRVPEATYLAWLDCRALELPGSAGQFFLDKAKVGLNFGETFGAQYAGFARLNFATPAPVLRQIVARMAEAVRSR
ncbi:MAG TPA: PatB family C-S lyase [Acetobacteraceae bacterium]|jgi:cystathionine beta-lyase|nr:PatB family C-S lyase [Acetobacteraceae bacterium]